MKTQKENHITSILYLAALLALPHLGHGQTYVGGTVSGTWTASGSPYIVMSNATVAAGTQLTI